MEQLGLNPKYYKLLEKQFEKDYLREFGVSIYSDSGVSTTKEQIDEIAKNYNFFERHMTKITDINQAKNQDELELTRLNMVSMRSQMLINKAIKLGIYNEVMERITEYQAEIADKMCNTCFSINIKLYSCGNCKSVKYCSKECQKKDWELHKHKDNCVKKNV